MHLTKEKRKLVTLERIRNQYQNRHPKGARKVVSIRIIRKERQIDGLRI